MSTGKRNSYKQELIRSITLMSKRSSLPAVPDACLRDMSTSSLAAFQEWLEPIIKAHPTVTPDTHRLLPKKR